MFATFISQRLVKVLARHNHVHIARDRFHNHTSNFIGKTGKTVFDGLGVIVSTSQSEGTGTGTGNQGNPFGEVDGAHRDGAGRGNNPSFSLSGRSILGQIPLPNYNNNEQGIIVVDIEVDKNGNVISARAGGKGTTIGNITMRKEAEVAAKRAKFNGITDNINQTGTITYRYVLR